MVWQWTKGTLELMDRSPQDGNGYRYGDGRRGRDNNQSQYPDSGRLAYLSRARFTLLIRNQLVHADKRGPHHDREAPTSGGDQCPPPAICSHEGEDDEQEGYGHEDGPTPPHPGVARPSSACFMFTHTHALHTCGSTF
jgi:hypothetical protein